MRELHGTTEQVMYQKTALNHVTDLHLVTDRGSDMSFNPSPNGANPAQPYPDCEGSFSRKGLFTTFITVTGSKPKHEANIQTGIKHGYQSHPELREASSAQLQRSTSLPNTQLKLTNQELGFIPRPESEIFTNGHSHKNGRQRYSAPLYDVDQRTQNDSNPELVCSKMSQVINGSIAHSNNVEETTEEDECLDSVPDLAAGKIPPYSQTLYNVMASLKPHIEPVFTGRRDIRNPSSVYEREIVSAKGTVRGFKNRVRAGIVTFRQQPDVTRNYRHLEQGKIIVYGTSMSVVRETSERCRSLRRLLQNHMVRYEERDLYMSKEIQQELRHRLALEGIPNIRLPHVFADGSHIGGAEELEKLNEAGELRGFLENYQKITVRFMCEKCGGYRFLPCEFCHGSKRSLLRNHFTEEFCSLRCVHCDENGLQRCDMCKDQQE